MSKRGQAGPFFLRDEAGTVVVVASGPSASQNDLGQCRRWATIAVNDSYRLVPWADCLYACDPEWWDHHIESVRQTFAGKLWTQDDRAAKKHGLNRIPGVANPGLSKVPGLIHFNANSGAQAINLAVMWGAKRLILVGFDMNETDKRRHWFGDHPSILKKSCDFRDWIKKFERIAKDLCAMGVQVWNCSPNSALPWFDKIGLDELCQQLTSHSGTIPSTGEMRSTPDCVPAATA